MKVQAIMRKALEEIAALRGMTLLGEDSGVGEPCQHEEGAHRAFNQAADIADEALRETK